MATTYTATVLGTYRSVIRNSLVCIAAGNSEAITIVHGLGACPTEIRTALRSAITSASGFAYSAHGMIASLNASQAVLNFGLVGQPAASVMLDIVCENTHSLVS